MVIKDIVLAIRFTVFWRILTSIIYFMDRDIPGCFRIPEGWRLDVGLEESVNDVTEA